MSEFPSPTICPFCDEKLTIVNYTFGPCLECLLHKKHVTKMIWAFYYDETNPELISDIHIRFDNYQLIYRRKSKTTELIDLNKAGNFGDEVIKVFDEFIPCNLSSASSIKNKIKTILTFL